MKAVVLLLVAVGVPALLATDASDPAARGRRVLYLGGHPAAIKHPAGGVPRRWPST